MLDFTRTWLPYLYLYVVGGLFFGIGLRIVLRHGALNLKLKTDRHWLKILLFGLVWYAAMHAAAVLAALHM